jgi:hypothetical protein
VEHCHGAFGEVTAVADLPFVVGLGEHGSGEAEQGGGVGEDADDVGAALDLLVQPLERVGAPDLLPVRGGEGGEGSDVVGGIVQLAWTSKNWRPSMRR